MAIDLSKLIPARCATGIGFVAAGFAVFADLGGLDDALRIVEQVFGGALIVIGLAAMVACALQEIRRSLLIVMPPHNGWIFADRDNGERNPICTSTLSIDLVVGSKTIELLSFKVLRHKDGMACFPGAPEVKLDGAPIKIDTGGAIYPVRLSMGATHRLHHTARFMTPLVNYYDAADMKAAGEVEITLSYRRDDAPRRRTTAVMAYRHFSTTRDTQADIYKPIRSISPPPHLNDQMLRQSRWRGWLCRADRDFAMKYTQTQRFVAVVKGRSGALLDGLADAEIERLQRISCRLEERRYELRSTLSRARSRFGSVGTLIVSAALLLRGLIARPQAA